MIPTALSTMLQQGVADFLRMSFWSSTPGMEGVIERFVATEGAVFKGPFVSVKLPFRAGTDAEFFADVPLGYPAHLHQEHAWRRLSGRNAKSTLVATGTGSGKTESFLLPVLDYCRRNLGTPGVKAIFVYPMNALATDQAKRIGLLCAKIPALKGVRAGLYIGERGDEKAATHGAMGDDHIITDRGRMQREPPDILLTNYKMLDYLLVRPADQQMWVPSQGAPVRFLVVDELHSFDGAQATDLACLIRRLKARLGVPRGSLCCVGTSATLGSPSAGATLRSYAEAVFGEPFDTDSVIGETRQSAEEFFGERLIELFQVPTDKARLDSSSYSSPLEYVEAQQKLWFDEEIPHPPGTDDYRVALGSQLLRHAVLRNLVQLLSDKPVTVPELTEALARTSRELRGDHDLAQLVVVSFLSLVSEARSWRPERADTKRRRETTKEPQPTRPMLEVRVQLWQRELRRMVADVSKAPSLRYSDDLTDEQRTQHLPVIHCRDCGAMGWASCVARDRTYAYGVGLERFYRAFFGNDPQVRFLWPAAAVAERDDGSFKRFHLDPNTLTRLRGEILEGAVEVAESGSVHTKKGHHELTRDCPFCGARESLTLLGFRASTLTSVFIDQLFASRFNDDKKLLAFSDSVQDAAHRAGFFGARTWGFNLRVAVQKVVANAEGRTLAELPVLFREAWRTSAAPAGLVPFPNIAPLDDVAYVSTFLAPSMAWLSEYEAMLRDQAVPVGTKLVEWVDRRVSYEIANEYGLQARIGRSLPRTGCSTLALDSALLNRANDALLEPLRNEIGGLRDLDRTTLRTFLLGALHHLREAGGIDHPELPREFVETAGDKDFAFKMTRHLPAFGPRSRFGALLTNVDGSRRFDDINAGGASGWYDQWIARTLGGTSVLIAGPGDIWMVVLPVLVRLGILKETEAKRGGRVWGLAPEALRVTRSCTRLRCPNCRHWVVVAASEAAEFRGGPCLSPPCLGFYGDDEKPASHSYFGRLIAHGEVERVFPEEHTGLLDRKHRERIETEFKTEDRKPWYPNLLSCTPTLEMGIDIGSLSSAILCSVPPAQANYLQRIGRAGRRDGNSFVLTIAQAKPHDLYFYAQPTEMLAGDVQPPGVFLNASAVLERQLAAFSLDQWNASPGQHKLSPRLREVFDQLETTNEEHFPHNWLSFVRREQERLLRDFVALFNPESEKQTAVLTESTITHLCDFLLGNDQSEGSLSWKVLDALQRERKAARSLRKRADDLKKLIKELKAAVARDKDHEEKIAEHKREQIALDKLAVAIQKTLTLEFLTNEGLLPNYAFPEAPVRLRSIIWRKKAHDDAATGSSYETRTFEYARPSVAALSDLAPSAEFYAGGRRVRIDQVDVDTAEIETWRFCDACTHCSPVSVDDAASDCPSCGSPAWGEESQRRQLLRLQQVFARTSDRDSRIRDDREERQPRFFSRHTMPTFRDEDRQGAWKLGSGIVPFAFEYLRRAMFRELNFGESSDDGAKFNIAGRSEARQGFIICKKCGKVQEPRGHQQRLSTDVRGEHTAWCSARQRGEKETDFEAAVYLYRQFSSEAVRLLLPMADIGSERRLHSFLAALQLGLKDKYSGRVDHLGTLVYSEPERGSLARRHYLVIYDTVPGGTGYLKDLMREPAEGEEHAMLTVLRRARDRIRSCECFGDPSRDGCYRCLFAYRNSRDMSETSAHEALAILTDILDHADTLERAHSLSDISVAGLMDSVLEARFVEALQRFSGPDLPVAVRKSLVRNKPGFLLTVGAQEWLIEPQVDLGAAQGVAVPVSIDFVLRPVTAAGSRKPVAIFLDGFQYHRDRVGYDMLQRMSLLSGGAYDVWCFTWHDVDAAFDRSAPPPPLLLHPAGGQLHAWLRKLDLGASTRVLDAAPLELLLRSLSTEVDEVPWQKLAAVTLIAHMSRPSTESVADWKTTVRDRVPEPFHALLARVTDQWLIARRPPGELGTLGLWAATTLAAARDTRRVEDFHAILWLDDSPAHHDEPAYREAWRGYLFAFLLLRALPNVLFLTKSSAPLDKYASLAQLRRAAASNLGEAWVELDVGADFSAILGKLAEARVPLPTVGVDLPDAGGLSSGVEGELVWESQRVAVVRELREADARRIAGEWKVFSLESCLADVGPLVAALQGAPAGDLA
jgi:DEAD/DEAH box helicase domain-containing protein